MSPANRCNQCGGQLVRAVDGLCPACLAGMALAPDVSPPVHRDKVLPQCDGYDVLEEIGRGGMGVVFKARQKSLNRVVALKMILAGELASSAEIARFRREAEAVANLRHPSIITVHEVAEGNGQPFFSMDYVDGPSLGELASDHPLESKRAARYMASVADAIAHAHSRGVLHRDLKPKNILIDPDDHPRVADFGLARRKSATRG